MAEFPILNASSLRQGGVPALTTAVIQEGTTNYILSSWHEGSRHSPVFVKLLNTFCHLYWRRVHITVWHRFTGRHGQISFFSSHQQHIHAHQCIILQQRSCHSPNSTVKSVRWLNTYRLVSMCWTLSGPFCVYNCSRDMSLFPSLSPLSLWSAIKMTVRKIRRVSCARASYSHLWKATQFINMQYLTC